MFTVEIFASCGGGRLISAISPAPIYKLCALDSESGNLPERALLKQVLSAFQTK